MFVITTESGFSFTQSEQETILNSAGKSGVNLPYSCQTGRCSTCKCKVISGDTFSLVDEVGLTQKEKDNGWILTCARSATSNLVIAIDDLGDMVLPKPALFPCRINSINKVSKHVVRVSLRLPPLVILRFCPANMLIL